MSVVLSRLRSIMQACGAVSACVLHGRSALAAIDSPDAWREEAAAAPPWDAL